MANRDNHRQYELMTIGTLTSLAQSTGLIRAVDIDFILTELGFVPSSVLEVGAGGGRVVDALLAKLGECEIFALERSPNFIDYLRNRFAAANRVKIMPGDVASITLPLVDLTLWLWSGIADFSPDEQPVILSRLAACTRRTVVLETPMEGAATNAHSVEGQWHICNWDNGTEYRGYVPTTDEFRAYARTANLRLRDRVVYTTPTNRHRVLYLLEHQTGTNE